MPVFYNPLGTRAIEQDTIQLAAGATFDFGFNGIVHMEWRTPGAPSAAYFEALFQGVWQVVLTFPIAGAIFEGVMVANGITRVRRQAAGGGLWSIRYAGWRFT